MSVITAALIGKKVASYIIPAIVGGVCVAIYFLTYNGCGSSKNLQQAETTVQSNDSSNALLKLNTDSLYNAGLNDGISLGKDAERSQQAKNAYKTIAPADENDSTVISFLLAKVRDCDSLITFYDMQVADLQRSLDSKDGIIGLQNERLNNFSRNESVLHKLLDSTEEFHVPVTIPALIKYDFNLKLGSGIGAVFAAGAEGALRFGKNGIFLESKLLFQDKIRGYLVGGYVYNLYSN